MRKLNRTSVEVEQLRQRRAEYSKQWKKEHPEYWRKSYQKTREWTKTHWDRIVWLEKERMTKKMNELMLTGLIKCKICGYDKDWRALELDHIIPVKQGRGKLRDKCYDKAQVSNWQILCANCHAIKTFNEQSVLSSKRMRRFGWLVDYERKKG
jgi:5-methylcytosine-specific restriction endonuclease McrA